MNYKGDTHLQVFPTLGVHVGLLVSLVLQPLGLVHNVLLVVVEGLGVCVPPLEVAVVDPLGSEAGVGRRQHHPRPAPARVIRPRRHQGRVRRRGLHLCNIFIMYFYYEVLGFKCERC